MSTLEDVARVTIVFMRNTDLFIANGVFKEGDAMLDNVIREMADESVDIADFDDDVSLDAPLGPRATRALKKAKNWLARHLRRLKGLLR